jgi:hypothetical protein
VPGVVVDADTAASALAETWQHLLPAVPGGWVVRDGGAVAMMSGVPLPGLNGVWPERVNPEPHAVAALLDRSRLPGFLTVFRCGPGPARRLLGWPQDGGCAGKRRTSR